MLNEQNNSMQPDRCNVVPFPVAVWGMCSMYGSKMYASTVSKARPKGFIDRTVAEGLIRDIRSNDLSTYTPNYNTRKWGCPEMDIEGLKRALDRWESLITMKDVQWIQVTSVTESVCTEGWDCTVPGPYTFSLWDGTVVQDTANIHVPVSDAAVREVYEKMLPSKNLISVRKHSIQYPIEKEYRQGIYLASRMKSDKAERTVDSIQEAIRMYNNNEIDIDTPIEIRHK